MCILCDLDNSTDKAWVTRVEEGWYTLLDFAVALERIEFDAGNDFLSCDVDTKTLVVRVVDAEA